MLSHKLIPRTALATRKLRVRKQSPTKLLKLTAPRRTYFTSIQILEEQQQQQQRQQQQQQQQQQGQQQEVLSGLPGLSGMEGLQEFMALDGYGKSKVYAYQALRKKFGDVVKLEFPHTKTVLAFDPEDIRKVYAKEGKYPIGIAQIVTSAIREVGGESVATLTGPKWKEIRSLVQKDITPPPVAQSYLKLLHPTTEKLIDNIEELVEREDGFIIASIDMLHTIIYGDSVNPFNNDWEKNDWNRFIQEGKRLVPILMSYLQSHSIEGKEQAKKELRELLDIILEVCDKELARILKEQHKWKELPAMPYLARVLSRGDEGVNEVTHGNTVSSLITAGLDTTAHSLSLFMYNLGTNPHVQEKLHQEVSSVCQGNQLVESHLKEVPYLRACLKEMYRLNSPSPSNARVLETEMVLKGHSIPPGIPIEMSSYPYCLDDNVFPNASEYLPERWMNNAQLDGLTSFLLLPFGTGARMCLGARVAEAEMMAFISSLVQKYKFKVTNSPLKINSFAVARHDPPAKFSFERRN